jgi:hypothetical protein
MATGTEILLLAGTVSSGFLIFSLNRGTKMRDDRRLIAELLWYATGLLPLAGVCLIWASMGDQPVTYQRIILGIVGAVIGGCALVATGEWIRPGSTAMAQSQPTSNSMGPVIDNHGIVTQGQNGNNVVVQGVVPRHLGDPEKEALIARIPKNRKISVVFVLNDSDATDLATEYADFLRNSGYSVEGPAGMMIWTSANTSPRGVNVDLNLDAPQNPVQITVGIRK